MKQGNHTGAPGSRTKFVGKGDRAPRSPLLFLKCARVMELQHVSASQIGPELRFCASVEGFDPEFRTIVRCFDYEVKMCSVYRIETFHRITLEPPARVQSSLAKATERHGRLCYSSNALG